jgi:hypothetical protein
MDDFQLSSRVARLVAASVSAGLIRPVDNVLQVVWDLGRLLWLFIITI